MSLRPTFAARPAPLVGSPALVALLLLLLAGRLRRRRQRAAPQPTRSPAPTFTAGKPGGTLRVVGTVTSVPLDPAMARDDAALLVNRLIYRQLYSYRPGDPEPRAGPRRRRRPRSAATGSPRRSRCAGARWNTTGRPQRHVRRRPARHEAAVLAGRCSRPSAATCPRWWSATRTSAPGPRSVRLGAGAQPDLDASTSRGCAPSATPRCRSCSADPPPTCSRSSPFRRSPRCPFEIKDGFPEPSQLISDGPYRFIEPEAGEAYRLSRNAAWDPAADPIAHRARRPGLLPRRTDRRRGAAAAREQRRRPVLGRGDAGCRRCAQLRSGRSTVRHRRPRAPVARRGATRDPVGRGSPGESARGA